MFDPISFADKFFFPISVSFKNMIQKRRPNAITAPESE